MMSLEFFPETARRTGELPEWGTGRLREETRASLWTPKGPTWQCMLPNPQHSEMHKLMSDLPFPAEHPYSSHQSRFAVFPKFDSPADPKKGVKARARLPKSDEMPANAYDVTVVSKIKGSGVRHEIQQLPPESRKEPLEWHEHSFHQLPKSPSSNRQKYYPTPPKTYVPNLRERQDSECGRGDMAVTPRTANAMRNIERAQWKTTYDLNHTGLGSSDPLELDNYDSKMAKLKVGVDDDNLYPRSVRTFDPARPAEGRIARAVTAAPPAQKHGFSDGSYDTRYKRQMSLTEKEEHRLLEGGDYVNLPEGTNPYEEEKARLQREKEQGLHAGTDNRVPDEHVSFGPTGEAGSFRDEEQEHLMRAQHETIQQMEAADRWRLLESQKPHHDITALQRKMDVVSVKTQPRVFYAHEGEYQRERAGLYKTSYDPSKLEYAMNKEEKRGAAIMDISDCHRDSLNVPVSLNGEMAEILKYNRTLGGPPGSVAQPSSQPSQFEVFGPFNAAKRLQKDFLQPTVQTADVRTQEGHPLLNKDSVYGSSYNTEKFLQENQMPFHARNEPLDVMSSENQNLNRARLTTIPRPDKPGQFDNTKPVSASVPLLKTEERFFGIRPQTAPEITNTAFGDRYSYQNTGPKLSRRGPDVRNKAGSSASFDQFASKSSNLAGGGDWGFRTAYQSQFPGSASLDLSFKNDERFDWTPGSGTPRPQSTILDIQNSFSKTQAKKQFNEKFPEQGPDLRENMIVKGKKHTFGGMNAQVLRGAPIDVA